ncbi:MAG TPA: hypothetical protein VKQ32_02290 [Polyangia bacterium]|nr:hypothetical protein [Polyangia bacterium]
MRALRTGVVGLILISMLSGAAPALARSEPKPAPIAAEALQVATTVASAVSKLAAGDEASQYARREQQSQGVQDFRGGMVYVYFGSGLVLALVIILLILVI